MAGNNFGEKSPVDSANSLGAKNFVESALSRTISEICAFAFYAKIQDGGKVIFVKSCQYMRVKNCVEIALPHTVSEILKIFHFQR